MKRSIYPSESAIQQAIVEWALNYAIAGTSPTVMDIKAGDYLFAIPNGGYRNKLEARKLKEQGVKKGVSDLFFAIPRLGGINTLCGLFLEVKTSKGKLTEEQANWIVKMRNACYGAVVVRSVDEGIQAIKDYLGMR